MKRKSTGKRTRFEIFKRDGFRCVYCGVTPVQSVLRVDHVVPIAEGGGDDPANLVTSCFDCNAGKSAVPLEERKFSPAIVTEAQREHAEQIREYLAIQKEVAAAKQEMVNHVADHWERTIGPLSQEMFDRLPGLLREWPVERVQEAIDIVGGRFRSYGPYNYRDAVRQQKYFYGILRRWREEQGGGGA